MWDLKTEAPAEIRGEFKPIATNVPGIQICEVFPQLAARMDKCAVIRSIVGASGGHDALQCMTGWDHEVAGRDGRPAEPRRRRRRACRGRSIPSVPPFVGLAAPTQHMPWSDSGTPGFLGAAYGPFKPDGPGMANLTLKDVTLDRLRRPQAACWTASTASAATSTPTAPSSGIDAFTDARPRRAHLQQAASTPST